MAWQKGWLVRWLVISSVSLIGIAACGGSDDDDDGASSPYAGVLEWRCFDGGTRCSCDGLKAGQDSAGSDPVESCSGSVCKTYLEDDWWNCECRDADWDPNELALDPITEQHEVASCPP